MTRRDWEQAIAFATGESRREIRRRGFQPLLLGEAAPDGEWDADGAVVDWDALEAERPLLFP